MFSAFLRKADGVVFMYDMTDTDSFENVALWEKIAADYAPPTAVHVLVGNKVDLKDERKVTRKTAEV